MPALLSSFTLVAPIFALVLIGFSVAKTRIISQAASHGLSEFVFTLAIPALLFRTVAEAKTPDVNPFPYWATYFLALGAVWLIADIIARRTGRTGREVAVIGFTAAQANTVMIGLPLILSTLGEAGKLPVVLLLGVHLPVTMTIVTIIIARGEGGGLKALLTSLFTHPILIGIIAGLLYRLTGWPLPGVAKTLLKLIGDTAAPCALIAMGMSMTSVSLSGARGMITIISVLKLIVHPVLVYALAVYVFKLPPAYAASAVMFAACPSGINAFLVAERYKAGAVIASGTIAFSTLAAALTMTVAVMLALSLIR